MSITTSGRAISSVKSQGKPGLTKRLKFKIFLFMRQAEKRIKYDKVAQVGRWILC